MVKNVTPSIWVLTLFNFFILVGAWMLAVWIRLFMPFGKELGDEYQPWANEILPYLLIATVLALSIATISGMNQATYRWLHPHRQFRVLMIEAGIGTGLIFYGLPDISQLQVIYFFMSAFIIGSATILFPGYLRRHAYHQISIQDNLADLYAKRSLLLLWLRFRIEERYSQTLLGILWIILLPLSTSAVLAFAFGQLIGVSGEASWVPFLLSGIAIFTIFQDIVLKAKESITSAGGIIGKVYFPREILVILVFGEIIVDFIFVFITLVVINALHGIFPTWHYILLPIPIIIVAIFSLGFAFLIAWLSLLIRDLQQLMTVFTQFLFYVVVLFSPERVASDYTLLINAIPLTPIISAVRDIILFERTPDMVSLFYPFVVGVTLLYFGYVYFKVNEDRFMDFV